MRHAGDGGMLRGREASINGKSCAVGFVDWVEGDFIGWLDDKMALLRVWETYVAPLKPYRGKDDVFLPFLQTLSSGTFNHFFHPQDSHPSEVNQRVIQVDRRAQADFAAYWERLDPDLVSLPNLWRERLLGLREIGKLA